jgi:DNA-directed RNA polymerase specialized sigma24 family protein
MPFRVGWRRRPGRLSEAEGAISPIYEVALRLTGEARGAEALVERALAVYAAWRRTRGNGARAAFRLFDALYATHRAAHGSPVEKEADADEGALASGAPPLPVVRSDLSDVGRLTAAVDALPGGLWHPLWLRDRQGFGYEDIALLLDVPSNRVASLLSRARRRVRESLRQGGSEAATTLLHDATDSGDARSGARRQHRRAPPARHPDEVRGQKEEHADEVDREVCRPGEAGVVDEPVTCPPPS